MARAESIALVLACVDVVITVVLYGESIGISRMRSKSLGFDLKLFRQFRNMRDARICAAARAHSHTSCESLPERAA